MSTPTERYWSVTTLQKAGLGLSDAIVVSTATKIAEASIDSRRVIDALLQDEGRDAAIDWLERRRFQSLNAAKDRGTDIHKAAENLALGKPVTIDEKLMPWVEQYKAWLDQYAPTFLMSEAPVYNTTWHYAGTLDGIIELDGRHLLFDIKTTEHGPDTLTRSGRPKSRPPFPEVALQLVAYARAERVGLVSDRREAGGRRYYVYDSTASYEPMPKVDGALCVVISPFDCFAVPVPCASTNPISSGAMPASLHASSIRRVCASGLGREMPLVCPS